MSYPIQRAMYNYNQNKRNSKTVGTLSLLIVHILDRTEMASLFMSVIPLMK